MTTSSLSSRGWRARCCLAVAATLSLGMINCVDDAAGDAEDVDDVLRGTISTYYLGAGNINRKICALHSPQGTYNAAITSKTWIGGQCENQTGIMSPVPADKTTSEFCAALGLDIKAVEGGISYCVTKETQPNVVDVYCYEFSQLNTEVNFRVVDVGDGVIFGSSGWQPGLDNGCPRDGFPW